MMDTTASFIFHIIFFSFSKIMERVYTIPRWDNGRCPLPLQYGPDTSGYPLSLQEQGQTKNRIQLPYLGCRKPNLHFPVLIEFKSVWAALWVINYFPPYNHFSIDETLQSSCCSFAISMEYVPTSYIS